MPIAVSVFTNYPWSSKLMAENEEHLLIRVKNNNGEETRFQIMKDSKMKQVFKVYAAKYYKSAEISSLRFCFNDKLISETDTWQSLQLEDGSQIDCYTNSEFLLRLFKSGISFSALLEKLNDLPRSAIIESSFVHQAVLSMTENTSLDFMDHLIRDFPDEVSRSTDLFCPYKGRTTRSYLLHLACHNNHCPNSVVQSLIKLSPDTVLRHFCGMRKLYRTVFVKGSPLLHYLSREENIDIDMVKLLVEAYPQALVMTDNDDIRSTPIHVVISNSGIKNKCEIITSLLDPEPSSVRFIDAWGKTLLARICSMSGVDSLFEVVQLLIGLWPEALMFGDECGYLPIHHLCENSDLDDSTSLDILYLLINDDATMLRLGDEGGFLPLHCAATSKSTRFCKELLVRCPETVKAESNNGELPIHEASRVGRLDTVRYLLEVYPESVNISNNDGCLPIHRAVCRIHEDSSIEEIVLRQIAVIELLLEYDTGAASKATRTRNILPLHLACMNNAYDGYSHIVQLLFDQYPAAIWACDRDGCTPLDLARRRQKIYKNDKSDTAVIGFLEDQLKYVTKDMVLDGNESTTRSVFWSNIYKCTQDGSGSLPLHHSLRNSASLGVIKVLLYGNPGTLRVTNHQGFLPIHIACQYSSVKVVKFLVEEHENGTLSLNNNGPEKNSLLHFACRSGDCEKVNYLLDKQAAAVSARNTDQKLPIHLLCESGGEDESVAYVETIWRMLLANPEL